MRTFIAIDVSSEVSDYLKELQAKIKEFNPDAKLTYPKDFHITLKFLGDVEDKKIEQVRNILKKVGFVPFYLRLGNPGYFDDKALRVAWLGLEDNADNCGELLRSIDKNLIYFFAKETKFVPHITLARIKHVENPEIFKEHIKALQIESKQFKIDSFQLIKSNLAKDGPEYEVLEEYK